MASPQSGNAGQAVPPADPVAPFDADNADPGQMTAVKAQQQQTQTGKYGASSDASQPFKPPQTPEERKQKTSWIEVVLVDEENKPVPGEPYKITLPDGQTVAEGTLDEKGFVRLDGIDPGSCKITFPQRDQEAWKTA